MIKEAFLHYLWRTKNFDHTDLQTKDNRRLKIIRYGELNPSDGPDFLNAQVEIDNVLWSGAIEIHINSSDWNSHGHSSDPNYKSTILHVVYYCNTDIKMSDEEIIPCLELKQRISTVIIQKYNGFNIEKWIPCSSLINSASEISTYSAKEKALSERLSRRWSEVNCMNQETEADWEELGYRHLCRSFGLVHNADAFLELSKLIPLKTLKKNSLSKENLEALFFGAAGLLDYEYKDEYPKRLKKEYEFFKKKYKFSGKTKISLKHKAVRPQNFPAISLSQFVDLMSNSGIVFKLMNAPQKEIIEFLKVTASPYWNNHYTFDKLSTLKKKTLGISRIRTIILNAIVPTLYYLGKKYGDENKVKRAIGLLENLPTEQNSIISKWRELGVASQNAYDSQGLLELKKNFCDKKRCLVCPIGHDILKNN